MEMTFGLNLNTNSGEDTAVVSPIRVLAQSGVASSVTGTTAETALATVTVPASTMAANDAITVTTLWSFTGSVNLKTLRGRLGGISGSIFLATGRNTLTEVSAQLLQIIRNRATNNSQVAYNSGVTAAFSVATTAVFTSTVDMSAAQDIVITGQLANSAESITLEGYTIELVKHP